MFEKLLRIIRKNRLLRGITVKILLLIRPQIEKGLNVMYRMQEVCSMNFTHYLPNTEERIDRLRRIINKRPVAIILPGFSVTELEKRITELKNYDICYACPNTFKVFEEHILQKINRKISLFMCSAPPGLYTQIGNHNIIDFLERQEDNIFISDIVSFHERKMPEGFNLDTFIKKYDKKLLFFTATAGWLYGQVPNIQYPLNFPKQNSLSILLSFAVIGGASEIILFGADGGRINKSPELYFRESNLEYTQGSKSQEPIEKTLMLEAEVFNVMMPLVLEKTYRTYNLEAIDIFNCSEQSHYTTFTKLSYDDTFALLKHSS
ncbi:hypothetical protein ACFLXK_02800 [Chloroflexota bacterium]